MGALLLRVDVGHAGRYIEPRKYSAFGGLAFWEVPELSGTAVRLSLTAVPGEWLGAAERIIAFLAHLNLPARIYDRTLEIRSDSLAPSALLKRSGLALFALDAFTKERASSRDFERFRRAASGAFKNEGDEVFGLLDEKVGAYHLRNLLGAARLTEAGPAPEKEIASALIDVGTEALVHFHCGRGALLRRLAEAGHLSKAIGVEPSATRATQAKSRMGLIADIHHGSLLEPPDGLPPDSMALVLDALPSATDKRLERAAEVLFEEIGFESVLFVETAARSAWTLPVLNEWAGLVCERYGYQSFPRRIETGFGVLVRRTDKSRKRREAQPISEMSIPTKLGRTVRIETEQWRSTLEAFSKWTVDPRWLIYLPPGLCSLQMSEIEGALEHPKAALEYYRAEEIRKVVVQYKHMGSRAIAVVCRDESAAERRFGIKALGSIYTRNGRPFWDDPMPVLAAIREALNRAKLWERLKTDWICLDGEILPWALKAENLIEETHGEMLLCGEAQLRELRPALERLSPGELPNLEQRSECFRRYRALFESYQAEAGAPFRFAPFHLIAAEGRTFFDRNHNWHMEVLQSIVQRAGDPLSPTIYQTFSLDDERAIEKCCAWWNELSESGAEGVVVKPLYFAPRGRRGLAQPGIKCRGNEHLRMVYGPEYDLLANRWDLAGRDALKRRREKHRRVLKQLALSIEGVERFVRNESPRNVEMCVRGVLALER